MKEQIATIKEKLQLLNSKFSTLQKISIAFVLLLSVAVIVAVVINSTSIEYSYLVVGISDKEASKIVPILQKERVPYKLSGNGTKIMVPKSKVLDLRLKLAGMGLPSGGGVGYEIFDHQDVTTLTEFTEKINLVRALQGELSRTISHLDSVKSARVHIVIPKESVFTEDQKKTTASILLDLEGGNTISKNKINAIVNLVASSIEGLNKKDITIASSSGNLLYDGNENNWNGLSDKKLAYKKKIEENLKNNILSLIVPIVGTGKVRVAVNADLNFDEAEKHEELYDPEKTAVRSENKLEKSTQNQKGLPGGVAGTQSNLPGKAGKAVASSNASNSQLEKTTTNYEINKTLRNVKETVGKIQQISASVVLDGITVKKGKKIKIVPLNKEKLAKIDALVKSAIGFNAKRGDKVVVSSIPFVEKPTIAKIPFYKEIVPYVFQYHFMEWIVVLMILLFVVRPLIKAIKSIEKEQPIEPVLESAGTSVSKSVHTKKDVSGGFEDVADEDLKVESAMEGAKEFMQTDEEKNEIDALGKEIEASMGIAMSKEQVAIINFARKNTELTSKILKRWIRD